MFSRLKSKNVIRICFLFLAAFFVGTGAAFLHDHFFPAAVPTSSEGNWGLSFQTDGDPPVGNATFDELKKFDAFYALMKYKWNTSLNLSYSVFKFVLTILYHIRKFTQ